MMSKKQWFVLLCVYIIYLCLGASIFQVVEHNEEIQSRKVDKQERKELEGLLMQHYVSNEEHSQEEIFEKLTTYCGKPLNANMSDIDPPLKWDFYHSLFFVITVVSTIGYGNLSPTTPLTRIFMIFYGIIGIPMNGIVIITLGDFFGKSFLKLYDRWKTLRVQHALATLGLVGQIVLYLIPGFTFFIFLPSIVIMIYEEWTYDVAVSYAFVTLTTIGFGDYVAGTNEMGYGGFIYTVYKIFLLVWIISGLGYIVMVLGFVSRGMRSKKMHDIEHKIAHNIKKTNHKIREELRTIVNEYLLMRVKRVYREKSICIPNKQYRSYSCPDLSVYCDAKTQTLSRKRAVSAFVCPPTIEISRNHSDTDLDRIDKEKTFKPSVAIMEPSQLLLRVVNALGNYETLHSSTSSNNSKVEGVDLFSSSEVLASEKYGSGWSLGSQKLSAIPPRIMRPRAASECKQPMCEKVNIKSNDMTWYGPAATKRLQELRAQVIFSKNKNKVLPPLNPTQSLSILTRIKNTFKSAKDDKKVVDIERQDSTCTQERKMSSDFTVIDKEQILEETSIADFLRALTAISVPEMTTTPPKRKFGTASLTPPEESPPRNRRLPLRPPSRRSSLIPPSPFQEKRDRRFSLMPDVPEQRDLLAPPPAYSLFPETINTRNRFTMASSSSTYSPVQRHAMRFKNSVLGNKENESQCKENQSTS